VRAREQAETSTTAQYKQESEDKKIKKDKQWRKSQLKSTTAAEVLTCKCPVR